MKIRQSRVVARDGREWLITGDEVLFDPLGVARRQRLADVAELPESWHRGVDAAWAELDYWDDGSLYRIELIKEKRRIRVQSNSDGLLHRADRETDIHDSESERTHLISIRALLDFLDGVSTDIDFLDALFPKQDRHLLGTRDHVQPVIDKIKRRERLAETDISDPDDALSRARSAGAPPEFWLRLERYVHALRIYQDSLPGRSPSARTDDWSRRKYDTLRSGEWEAGRGRITACAATWSGLHYAFFGDSVERRELVWSRYGSRERLFPSNAPAFTSIAGLWPALPSFFHAGHVRTAWFDKYLLCLEKGREIVRFDPSSDGRDHELISL